jgi:hypothetical protein
MTSLLLYIGSLIFLYTVALINLDYVSAYYAQAAGLDYGLSLSDNGFELSLAGFNHKLRILLEAVIQKIAKFEVKPDRFSVIKVTLLIDIAPLLKLPRRFFIRSVRGKILPTSSLHPTSPVN